MNDLQSLEWSWQDMHRRITTLQKEVFKLTEKLDKSQAEMIQVIARLARRVDYLTEAFNAGKGIHDE